MLYLTWRDQQARTILLVFLFKSMDLLSPSTHNLEKQWKSRHWAQPGSECSPNTRSQGSSEEWPSPGLGQEIGYGSLRNLLGPESEDPGQGLENHMWRTKKLRGRLPAHWGKMKAWLEVTELHRTCTYSPVHLCISSFWVAVTKYLAETIYGRKDLFWLIVLEGYSPSWPKSPRGNGWAHGGRNLFTSLLIQKQCWSEPRLDSSLQGPGPSDPLLLLCCVCLKCLCMCEGPQFCGVSFPRSPGLGILVSFVSFP